MKAVYPGTFDPVTNGHIDIIKRALKIFDKIVIAVGENPTKQAVFPTSERIEMLKESTKGLSVEVDNFEGLVVDYLKKQKINTIKVIKSCF